MTEAYFFGEPDALRRAGAIPPPPSALAPDVEHFQTSDATFLTLPQNDRLTDMPMRALHPKSFLKYLCDPSLSNKKLKYSETKNGVAALELLAWEQVVQNAPYCPFLHAFLDDLSFALNCPRPFINSACADQRVRYPKGQNPVLRNI